MQRGEVLVHLPETEVESLTIKPEKSKGQVSAQDRVKIMKLIAKMPGLLSVESDAGIVFSKDASQEEIKEH